MKKSLILLAVICLFSIQFISAQTQMLWSKPPTPSDANNFNQNQYDCPIWNDIFSIFDLYSVQGSNDWVGYISLVVKDFNNDGYCDLFLPLQGGGEKEKIPFKLFLYNPVTGKLEDKSSLITNNVGNTSTRKTVSADFNGDNILDFVVVSHPEAIDADLSYLDVVMSVDNGWEQTNLSTVSRENIEGYYHGVAVGDVDNDGDIDFVLGNTGPDEGMITYINDGEGNFSTIFSVLRISPNVSRMSYTVELEDINLDGILDIIYWDAGTRIAYGIGDGTFGELVQEMDFGDYVQRQDFDFVDFDNDGDKDLIFSEAGGGFSENQLVFLRNDGITNEGKIIYNDITEPITQDLKAQGFYFEGNSKDWIPYFQYIDINNDEIKDIVKVSAFLNDFHNRYYMQNWVLIGQENLKFKYVNYPITSAIENIFNENTTVEAKLNYEIIFLQNVENPWYEVPYENFTMDNLRGEIDEWVVYYRQSPFGDKSLEGVKRVVLNEETISKEFLENNTFKYTFNFQPEFNGSDDIYARVTYVDEYGVENVLSEQIQFSVSEFDYDGDGVPNVSDDCPDTPTGVSVNANGCSAEQLSDDDGDGVPNYLDECPDTPNGEISDEKGCSESQKDDDGDGVMNDVDNCPQISNETQADLDGDGEGDVCDDDWDGDGILNDVDNCPEMANSNQLDLDGDGVGDMCDDDWDGDGVLNDNDNCPEVSNADQSDIDGDGKGDVCDEDTDGDGILNDVDNCPEVSNADQADLDNDGIGDTCDDDWDGDGVLNIEDNCPEKANENQEDLDNDGIGDVCDDDWDGDGVLNTEDNCPETSNSNQSDIDNDGLGDVCDDDMDGDSILNTEDNCPEIANENQEDLDSDGQGDACDDDWDGDGILNSVDNCPETANADQADFDVDNIGDICDDDIDGDGVFNDDDKCANTPAGVSVDANGCILLDSNNFTIEIISETCPDKDNGQIVIEAQASNSYIATVSGIDYDFTTTKTIDDLKPGDYEICIVITGQTSPYCYNITIVEGTTVSGKSSTTNNKTTVDILDGTAPYDVYVNGNTVLRTMSSTFDIDTKHGDIIEVKTDIACEGVYSKTIQLFDVLTLYPNPTEGLFELAIPLNLNEVGIELYNYNSQLISKRIYPVSYGKVQLDLTNKSTGMYYVKVLSDTPVMLKIIKK